MHLPVVPMGLVRENGLGTRGRSTNLFILFPLPVPFLHPSLPFCVFHHLVSCMQRPPEEGQSTEQSRWWAMARRLIMAVLLLGLLLGSSVLLFYIFRSCGPRKQDPGTPNPISPHSVMGFICPSPWGSMPTDLTHHSSWPFHLPPSRSLFCPHQMFLFPALGGALISLFSQL